MKVYSTVGSDFIGRGESESVNGQKGFTGIVITHGEGASILGSVTVVMRWTKKSM